MRASVLILALLVLAAKSPHARHPHAHDKQDVAVPFSVGGLAFLLPSNWQLDPSESRARVGQWQIPAPAGGGSDGLQVVAFFFGQGIGGTVQENIAAWATTVTTQDGHAANAAPQTRDAAGHKITEVMLSGTYAQTSAQPGLPPSQKPNYSLLGEVIENPAGNIYWRVTGPTAQVAAFAPVLDKILDGMQAQPVP